jgi:hypothetical protein
MVAAHHKTAVLRIADGNFAGFAAFVKEWRFAVVHDWIKQLQHVYRMAGHPDCQLPESGFEPFPKLEEKVAVGRRVFGVNEDAD